MYLSKYLKPGDFVTLVPIGVRLTLQYNVDGNLEKIFVGYDTDKRDLTAELLDIMLSFPSVPKHISINNGTSWVYGVLYTGADTAESGLLPDCIEASLIKQFKSNPSTFVFYAAYIKSTSVPILGCVQIRQYLKLSRFSILPGWYVPGYVDDSVPTGWLADDIYTFKPIVTTIFAFTGESVAITSTHTYQYCVVDTGNMIDKNGYYRIGVDVPDELSSDGGLKTVFYRYVEAAKYNITTGSIIYTDGSMQLIDAISSNEAAYSTRIKCRFCGKLFDIPVDAYEVCCPDVHCTSRLIPELEHFVYALHLPEPRKQYIDYIESGEITSVPDLLTLEEYADIEIHTTVKDVLRSLIPISVIASDKIISDFVAGCNNDADTVMYYALHTSDLASDLHLDPNAMIPLVEWLEDDCNISDLQTVLDSHQIIVEVPTKMFDGAPILMNKTICITGDFIHGSVSDISDIIGSYSGHTTTQLTSDINMVLVGGTFENVSSQVVTAARNMGIPVIDEIAFFNLYDIDSDLQAI